MMLKFTQDHEWVLVDGTIGKVGVTDYAQQQLGDVVFVELPEIDKDMNKGDDAAVVESVKAASEIYAPLTGKVVSINESLPDEPSLVNTDPLGEGWFFSIEIKDLSELDQLMDEAAYNAHLENL